MSDELILLYNSKLVDYLLMSESGQSEGYTPDHQNSIDQGEKNIVYKKRVEKVGKNTIEGKWTDEENMAYILYMDLHSITFISKEKRKSSRIFKKLSDFLVTRTPRQCRSHFQKIMNKFKKLKKVKQFYQQQLGIEQYQRQFEQLSIKIKGKKVKTEEVEQPCQTRNICCSTQTDRFEVCLSDLSNIELLKLMNILHDYQKTQFPFFDNSIAMPQLKQQMILK